MKRLLPLFATVSLLLSSCEKSQNGVEEADSKISFTSSIAHATRVTSDAFDVGDIIYVTALDGAETYANKVPYIYYGEKFESSTPISYESGSQQLSFQAVYPAVEEFADNFTFEVLADQSSAENYEMSDLLISTQEQTSDSSPALVFNHVLSGIVINITNSELEGGELKIFANNETTIDLSNQTYTATESSAELTPLQIGDMSYKVVVAPQTIKAGAAVASYSIDGKIYTWSANTNIELASGYNNTFSWNITDDDITFDSSTLEWDDDMQYGYLDLAYFSATKYPMTIDTWTIIDSSATTADFAGLSAAIEALSGSGREISLEFPNMTTIPEYAIFGTSSYDDATKAAYASDALVSVSAESATTIGQYAFYCCGYIKDVDFPAATNINTFAFYGCTSLTSICFPAATTFYNHCFRECTSLVRAEFPAALTLNQYVVQRCTSLTELHLATADGVRLSYIQNTAFNWTYTTSATVTSINLTVGSANADMVEGSVLYVGDNDFTFASITVLDSETEE